MAQIKINAMIEWVEYRLKPALEEAVVNAIPGVQVDKDLLWKEFIGVVNKKCSIWANIPDSYIRSK